jgi:hypothetical protein
LSINQDRIQFLYRPAEGFDIFGCDRQTNPEQVTAELPRLLSRSSQAIPLEVHCGWSEEMSQAYSGIQLAGRLYLGDFTVFVYESCVLGGMKASRSHSPRA